MDDFLEKTKKLSHKHLQELAVLCGGMAVLLFAAVFVSGGFGNPSTGLLSAVVNPTSQTASIFPCSWFGSCSGIVDTGVFSLTASPTVSSPGQAVSLTWVAYVMQTGSGGLDGNIGLCYTNRPTSGPYAAVYSQYQCNISGYGDVGAVCQITDVGDGTTVPCITSKATQQLSGTVTVYPTVTTTYRLCSNNSSLSGACQTATVTVATPTPTTLTSFTASPAAVTTGTATTLTWQGAKGTNFYTCELAGGQWPTGAYFTALPGSITTAPLSADTTYSVSCYDTNGTWTGWKSITVTATAPLGPCNDIPAQTTVPNGCVAPVPAPGICTPLGGSYAVSTNSCSCPTGTHLSGASCVTNPLCSNGLDDSYAPSCACPSGQYQPLGGSSCVALPICANGLSQTYSPSCTCPSGQLQSGTSCVLAGVINNLTANPSRVLKGNTATISWSTSHMDTCALSGFNAVGTSALSSALTSSLQQTITAKTIYTLSCTDASGASYSSSVTLNLIPVTVEQ